MVLENRDIRGILKSMTLDLENHEKLFNNGYFSVTLQLCSIQFI